MGEVGKDELAGSLVPDLPDQFLAKFVVKNLDTGETFHVDQIESFLRESSLLTFEYHSPSDEDREAARANGDYDTSLQLRMSSIQVSYWQPAIMRTWHYLQSGLIGALVDRYHEVDGKRIYWAIWSNTVNHDG